MAGRRAKDAWGETNTAWKPELVYGCVGGVLSIFIFAATGWPESPFVSAAIPLVSAFGAAVLVPLGQFLWRLLWQPVTDLNAQVVGLKTQVTELRSDGSSMQTDERLVVVLRNYVREGREMEAIRNMHRGIYETSERDELDDWTHSVITCLTEYGTKDQCERFIDAQDTCERDPGILAHRHWAASRVVVLEQIVEELDGQ